MNDKCIPTETKQRATKLHKLTKRSNSFAGYELRTSSSPSKIVGNLETHSSDSQLIVTECHSAPSSSRGEASEERSNVAPVTTQKTLTVQRRINSLNRDTFLPSLLSPRITLPYRSAPTLLGRSSLTSTQEFDCEEEQMQIDEPLSTPSSGVNSPRLSPAPKLGKLPNPKSKSCSSLDHVLPTVYEDDWRIQHTSGCDPALFFDFPAAHSTTSTSIYPQTPFQTPIPTVMQSVFNSYSLYITLPFC